MVKPATVNRIRTLSRQGKSANEIIRQLRREHRGIRRTTALKYIRRFKGRKPKTNVYKYTPRKYLTKEAFKIRGHEVGRKHIAIYGRVDGQSRRIEVSGTGHQLMDFLRDAVKHPPKERFVRGDVSTIHGRSKIKLDRRKEWDAKPKIAS